MAEAEAEVIGADKELENMFRAGAHFAYSPSRRHPKMSSFIQGIKNNVEIFDLEKTSEALVRAENFLRKAGEARKSVLWVGTKPSARAVIEKIGRELGQNYVARRWIGGTLTNFKLIRERLKYFEDLKKKQESGELEKYTKKERLNISREIGSLAEKFSGIENLKNGPEAIVIVDPREEKTAFSEARRVNLPIVAVLSSDNDPSGVAYPIPANDSAPSSLAYLLERLARAYREGAASSVPENNG